MSKQDKYTKSARGQPCQVMVPGVCKPAPENNTTVFAHLNGGGGSKHLNIHGTYSCDCCHSFLDYGYANIGVTRDERDRIHLEAVIRTQIIMVNEGILIL